MNVTLCNLVALGWLPKKIENVGGSWTDKEAGLVEVKVNAIRAQVASWLIHLK